MSRWIGAHLPVPGASGAVVEEDAMSRRPVVAAVAALSLACAAGAAGAADAHPPHWTYGGATGPAHWGHLEPEFGACGLGQAQSPIDIRAADVQKADLPPIDFAYKPGPLKLLDNGHTLKAIIAPGSAITVGGHRYELTEFHFHKPSEESIDGRRHDMVAHLVHRDAEGRLAVVAVLLDAGALNPMVAVAWNNWPAHKEVETDVAGVQVDATDLLPADHGYYTFAGSLTTPPCSEGVTWFVLRQPATLSAGEIARFGSVYPMNARPVQPLHDRVVKASP
jgi:carbonic anhydrase